jgi:hypothetical protein
MKNRSLWLLATLVALVLVVIVVDMATGMGGTGAAINFFWRTLTSSIMWILGSIREFAVLLVGRRAWGLASFATSIGFSYFLRIFLSERYARRVEGWREHARRVFRRTLNWWNERSLLAKFAIVAGLILLQILLVPTLAQYAVLFPVKFMVVVIFGVVRRIYGYIADSIIGVLYWKYCGRIHNRIKRRLKNFWIIRALRDAIRYVRLQKAAALRIWRYDPRYRDEHGELKRSGREPVRLWWSGELKRKYYRRPLLAGRRESSKEPNK